MITKIADIEPSRFEFYVHNDMHGTIVYPFYGSHPLVISIPCATCMVHDGSVLFVDTHPLLDPFDQMLLQLIREHHMEWFPDVNDMKFVGSTSDSGILELETTGKTRMYDNHSNLLHNHKLNPDVNVHLVVELRCFTQNAHWIKPQYVLHQIQVLKSDDELQLSSTESLDELVFCSDSD